MPLPRTILAFALIALLPAPGGAADNVVMVELFTSQGCSSCPPADSNLAELAAREDVLALSMHVDYWDYLGWRDTFAQAEHTVRQAEYRDKMGGRVLFTPQMVVDGRHSIPGFRRELIRTAIAKSARSTRPASILIERSDGMLRAVVATEGSQAPCTIWVVSYDQEATVAIERGENAGRVVTYHNVVEKLMKVGPWRGSGPASFVLPQPTEGGGVAIWLQDDLTGHILTSSFVEG